MAIPSKNKRPLTTKHLQTTNIRHIEIAWVGKQEETYLSAKVHAVT
jgi:hypothetical protein